MMKLCNYIIILVVVLTISAYSQETIYPSGGNIQSSFSVNEFDISIADTLIIRRAVVNYENFDLENMYFSENLPSEFNLVSYEVLVNGLAISHFVSGPISSYLITGYDNYYWVIDSPIGSEAATRVISPGDSVELKMEITCNTPGNFVLPLHTTVFSGNGVEYFSTSGDIEIDILLSVDILEDKDDLPKQLPNHLIARAYPNPFNSAVKIMYSDGFYINKQVSFTIFDILGKTIHSEKHYMDGNQSEIIWQPNNNVGSGIYFYKLSTETESYSGKVIYLK